MSIDDEVQKAFSDFPKKLQREIVDAIRKEARETAAAIRSAAPVDRGALRDSVDVIESGDGLVQTIVAGGEATSKSYERGSVTYRREVPVGQGNNRNIQRGGNAGVTYDHALAIEFGTTKMPAQPFFYPTIRARQDRMQQNIERAIRKVINEQ